MKRQYWGPKEKTLISKLSGVSVFTLSRILHRKSAASKYNAIKLENAAKAIGKEINRDAWLYAETTKHPAFYGRPDRVHLKLLRDTKKLHK